MIRFGWRKKIEDNNEYGLIITARTTRVLFCAVGSKSKATKSISRCHEYHEMCLWNMWKGINERLCSLQEIDPRVKDCLAAQQYKNFMASGGYKITFQWLKSWWDH